jgi:8-oxo-dGTP pyrophosphatase MutT (NUDIX family)
MTDHDLLSSKEALLVHIRNRLGQCPLDFSEQWHAIRKTKHSGEERAAAGVLLLLHDKPSPQTSGGSSGGLVLQLIKRSNRVSQGGDISCPGGMLHPPVDHGLAFLIQSRIIPAFRGMARNYARRRPYGTYRIMNLFLANAMREAWEEVRLSPFNVDFLGPLPTYSLSMFKRTIFPLVAYVKRPWTFRMNPEVDKVIEIPLRHFFEHKHYARFTIESSPPVNAAVVGPRHFPCFVHRDPDDHPEILWGATFNIIMGFLDIVFHLQLPDISTTEEYRRILSSDYITGRHKQQEAR